MTISWFPGHMHKARGELRKLARQTDLFVELLDARAPAASSNRDLERLFAGSPVIRILTKTDLADPEITRQWRRYLSGTVLVSSKNAPVDAKQLFTEAERCFSPAAGQCRRGRQLAIVGVPNVGKSTLVNHLAGRKLSSTGNEPAVTRGQQRVRLPNRWVLYDTPGLMAPRLDDQQAAAVLAMLGAIRRTAIDQEEIAWHAADLLLERYPTTLVARYGGIDASLGTESVLAAIAASRGVRARGGRPDWQRAGELLLNDLRSGKLGPLSLESPPVNPAVA